MTTEKVLKSIVEIKLVPSSREEAVLGWMEDGTLKVRVKEKPVKRNANHALIRYLSRLAGIPPSQLKIISGLCLRNKRVELIGISEEQFVECVSNALTQEP